MQVFDVNNWRQLERFSRFRWIYRGQNHQKYDLRTTLERCLRRAGVETTKYREVEEALIREFRRAYHQYAAHVPDAKHRMEWLALMQHHGAPTRLLDFSHSLYVATYFAVEEANDDDPNGFTEVWAVNAPWAAQQSAINLEAAGHHSDVIEKFLRNPLYDEGREEHAMSLFFDDDKQVRLACPVNPSRHNERLRTQKGIFLIAGSMEHSFMDNLVTMSGFDDAKNIVVIKIPNSLRLSFLKRLHEINIGRTSLFPGLDGFARSLCVFSPAYHMKSQWIKRKSNGQWVVNPAKLPF